MYFKFLFSLVLPILSFANLSSDRSDYQKIILDDYYSHAKPKDAKDKTTQNYKVRSALGIILDCSKYDFSLIRKMNNGKDPDKIHLVCKSGTFDIELNLHGETIIDKTTAHSIGEEKEFKGFEKGDTPILGIGTLAITGTKAQMLTYWVSMMDIE
ncbi:MAG: hypothetical protein BGO55_21195 [Sphingobacteriales bacterium 50-39]|nr:hypothetical protein [Sphingobacteriales bacterium]OJW59509.1 MAG: hypothetical protein BGO55_21195 [Sphingobacteriales bacterium 50-39]